jgi:catechol 2,3-dioxygenase-like lactoylglutathione lyase family enzyme
MLSIRSFVVNVRDLDRATEFWSAALGYDVATVADDWVTLTPPGGVPRLCLQLTDEAPPEFPHDHLDLDGGSEAAGVAAAVERLIALGAERVDWPRYEGRDDFVVLADPDGNRFCVVQTTET